MGPGKVDQEVNSILGVDLAPYNSYTVTLSTGEKITGEFDRYDVEERVLHLKPKYGHGDHHAIAREHIIVITRRYS